jgi:hypothetical protein
VSLPQLLRDYCGKQNRLAGEYALKSHDSLANHVGSIQELDADVSNKGRLLWENYAQQLRAAASGDDSAERSQSAYIAFQRDYAKLGTEYGKARLEALQRFAESMEGLQADARLQALDHLIGYLTAVRQAASAEARRSEQGGSAG